MNLKQKIIDDLKAAMKAGDAVKRDTLRMLDSMIKNVEIDKKKKDEGLTDSEIEEVIARAIKQRRDSAAQYEAGGRPELVESENKEIEILLAYMPPQLGEEDVRRVVKEIIAQVGVSDKSEIGKVMGPVMAKLKGQADGNLVKKIVEEELS